eukprot:5764474-Pyramimonas_sp.AAC.1
METAAAGGRHEAGVDPSAGASRCSHHVHEKGHVGVACVVYVRIEGGLRAEHAGGVPCGHCSDGAQGRAGDPPGGVDASRGAQEPEPNAFGGTSGGAVAST